MLTCTVFWIRPLLEAHYLCIAQDSRPHIPKSVVHAVGQLVQKFVFVSHHVAGVTMSQVNTHVSCNICRQEFDWLYNLPEGGQLKESVTR